MTAKFSSTPIQVKEYTTLNKTRLHVVISKDKHGHAGCY